MIWAGNQKNVTSLENYTVFRWSLIFSPRINFTSTFTPMPLSRTKTEGLHQCRILQILKLNPCPSRDLPVNFIAMSIPSAPRDSSQFAYQDKLNTGFKYFKL